MGLIQEVGLVNTQLLKYGSAPCFQQNGIEMRETRLEAYKPATTNGTGQDEPMVQVVYKGPFAQIIDDSGTTFHCGAPARIPESAWQRISSSPMADSFTKFNPRSDVPVSCGTTPAKLQQIG